MANYYAQLFREIRVKIVRRYAALLAPLCVAAASAYALPADQQGRSCHLPGFEEGLRCVSVDVPLTYPNDRARLAIHVSLAPAFRESARPDPLFILAGGPGEAGSDVLPLLSNTFRRARATRDIVFIDQRGTGLSGKLDCDDGDGADQLGEAAQDALLRACLAKLKRPFAAYTTANAARDIERVRLALGYGKINLWGGSYGTRLAQQYARLYPASVRALILDGVAAPDQVIPAGAHDAQAALDLLFQQCAASPACHQAYPALRREFEAVAARVAAGAVKVDMPDPRTAEPVQVSVTSARFLGTVHSVLYSALDSRRLPFLIHSAYQGRWAPFVARRNVASDLSAEGGAALVLHLAVVCAEDWPRLTPQLLAEDGRGAFMGNARIARLDEMCQAIHVPAVAWRAPAPIGAPTLLLSGALDPVTPPRRAEAAKRYMTHAQHLVAANVGHGVSQLGCAPRLLREFLDHPDLPVAAHCLSEIPAPTFQVGSAGPQP